MSNLSRFMKNNKKKQANAFHAPTNSLTDENGKPLNWEFKHITAKENEELRDHCTYDVQVKGKPNMYRPKLKTSKYLAEMIVASVVYPNLYDKALQDSYGVKTPVDLLYELVDDPGEYSALTEWMERFQGFDKTLNDKVDEAKNSSMEETEKQTAPITPSTSSI